MSVVEIYGGRVDRRYLMKKSKDELATMYLHALDLLERRTQPEATKPAQDLSAAILAMNRAKLLPIWDNDVPHKLHVELDIIFKALAALASPADALVAGDRVDAETPTSIVSNHEFMRALEAYTDTFPRAGKEALIDLRKTSDYGLVAVIDAAILQSQKDGHG